MASVRPLIQKWSFEQDLNGCNATRCYIDCEDNHPEATTLPLIGDSFDDNNANCTAKKISTEFLCERSNVLKRYTISYDSYVNPESTYDNTGNNSDLLPISIELASDYDTFTNQEDDTATDFWAWEDSPTERALGVTIFKNLAMETFIITRYVWGQNLEEYNTNAKLAVGKINILEFMGFAPETVRFDGASLEEVKNNRISNARKWLAKLKFSVKLNDGDSWQKLYDKKTNTYKTLIFGNNANVKLYDTYDLQTLFTFGEAPLFPDPVFPNR